MLIDFKEIDDISGFTFEKFIEELLKTTGWNIIVGAGQGPDGGRDIIASIRESFGTGKEKERTYLIQCKHNAKSGKSVSPSELGNFNLMPNRHNTEGWLLVSSTKLSENGIQEIHAASEQFKGINFDYWDAQDLEDKILRDECRNLFKRYFPESYKKHTDIIIPTIQEIEEIFLEWQKKYKQSSSLFCFESDTITQIRSRLLSRKITVDELRRYIFSDDSMNLFLSIWNNNLAKESIPGNAVLLFDGVMRVEALNCKGFKKESIEAIITHEILTTAHYRDIKRKDWKSTIIHKGSSYEWESFEIGYDNAFVVNAGNLLCGIQIILYCEFPEEAATGIIKLPDGTEHRFTVAFQLEGRLEIIKFPLIIPCKLQYKLDGGSDSVVFLSSGYAFTRGVDEFNQPRIDWIIRA
jgi:hypothetical protein